MKHERVLVTRLPRISLPRDVTSERERLKWADDVEDKRRAHEAPQEIYAHDDKQEAA